MEDLPSLLYVGPESPELAKYVDASDFDGVVVSGTIEHGVDALSQRRHGFGAALVSTSAGIDEVVEFAAYLKRVFPDVSLAILGTSPDAAGERLRLLGVQMFFSELTQAGIDTLVAVSRSRTRKVGTEDWSFKVERGNWVEISVPSKESYVARVQELIDMLERTNLDQDTRDELMLAIDELVRNAMEWGNRYDEDRRVGVSYYCAPDRVLIRVEDEGEGFDHSDAKDPTEDLQAHTEERETLGKRAGGFGLHLIRNLMDEVLYNEKGNVVILTKFLDRPN